MFREATKGLNETMADEAALNDFPSLFSLKGKVAVVEDAFADGKTPKGTPRGSGANTPARSRVQTPAASATGTPVGSGTENNAMPMPVVKKKKKKTRNELKEQAERRRLRVTNWLAFGGPKPEDTDSD